MMPPGEAQGIFEELFTQHRRRGILRSPYPRSCIACPYGSGECPIARREAYCQHKILDQCIKIRCGENYWTQCVGTKSFARARVVGVGREKQGAGSLSAHPLKKSATSSTDTSIHRLPP